MLTLALFVLSVIIGASASDLEEHGIVVIDDNGYQRYKLDGYNASGIIYVEAFPLLKKYCHYSYFKVHKVSFYLDGAHINEIYSKPYYFYGKKDNGRPYAFDTREWADGHHSLVVKFEDKDYNIIDVRYAYFKVYNGRYARGGLLWSKNANRTDPKPLQGAVLEQNKPVYIFWKGHADSVTFYLDGEKVRTEFHEPFDFAGTAADDTAMAFRFVYDRYKKHTIRVVVQNKYGYYIEEACFEVEKKDRYNDHYDHDDDYDYHDK